MFFHHHHPHNSVISQFHFIDQIFFLGVNTFSGDHDIVASQIADKYKVDFGNEKNSSICDTKGNSIKLDGDVNLDVIYLSRSLYQNSLDLIRQNQAYISSTHMKSKIKWIDGVI